MKADFQWQRSNYFTINLDGYGPVTFNPYPVCCLDTHSWIVAKAANGKR